MAVGDSYGDDYGYGWEAVMLDVSVDLRGLYQVYSRILRQFSNNSRKKEEGRKSSFFRSFHAFNNLIPTVSTNNCFFTTTSS